MTSMLFFLELYIRTRRRPGDISQCFPLSRWDDQRGSSVNAMKTCFSISLQIQLVQRRCLPLGAGRGTARRARFLPFLNPRRNANFLQLPFRWERKLESPEGPGITFEGANIGQPELAEHRPFLPRWVWASKPQEGFSNSFCLSHEGEGRRKERERGRKRERRRGTKKRRAS